MPFAGAGFILLFFRLIDGDTSAIVFVAVFLLVVVGVAIYRRRKGRDDSGD